MIKKKLFSIVLLVILCFTLNPISILANECNDDCDCEHDCDCGNDCNCGCHENTLCLLEVSKDEKGNEVFKSITDEKLFDEVIAEADKVLYEIES